jgi:hypothetical protein
MTLPPPLSLSNPQGNQWQPSDVQAALDYYEGEKFLGGSTEMPYEAEFVTNPLSVYEGGPEDSRCVCVVGAGGVKA